jgi:hypothetical protein
MNHEIPVTQAAEMTRSYRTMNNDILKTEYQNQNLLPLCETFDRAALDTLLAQDDCKQIRIYYGMDENYKVHAILVGVDGNGNDMIPHMPKDGVTMENAYRCPTDCPSASTLNS